MSEKSTTLNISLDELQTVRVVCMSKFEYGEPCGTVSEFPIKRLKHLWHCPVCGCEIRNERNRDDFKDFLKAIDGLKRDDGLKLQFVLPAKD